MLVARLDRDGDIPVAADEHDRDACLDSIQFILKCRAAGMGHANVEHEAARQRRIKAVAELRGGPKGSCAETDRRHQFRKARRAPTKVWMSSRASPKDDASPPIASQRPRNRPLCLLRFQAEQISRYTPRAVWARLASC